MSDRDFGEQVPPPGWLYDIETGRTRWWDGVRWTDLAKPLDPIVVRTPTAYARVPGSAVTFSGHPSSPRNGTSTAAVLLVVMTALALAAGYWLTGSLDPSAVAVLAVATRLLVTVAFVVAIAALVIAIQRQTGKILAIVALVASSLLLSLLMLRLLDGFSA
ncbi:DUF2510 domain-containing protein [Microbacterium sp. CFH 31415]|uniref:DUF2510 domain-containing protein n=1 Tax=Microbacterium sp. CFH 31415 TaxID=2921732 RepID=UPI001F1492F9|nr:DUF2510 domain-containing protein [Microbacterium sp. CFH 31415]MCH6229975.1 DUF2510 domain-containing protein [Microbacterium sp. CFH 31415]